MDLQLISIKILKFIALSGDLESRYFRRCEVQGYYNLDLGYTFDILKLDEFSLLVKLLDRDLSANLYFLIMPCISYIGFGSCVPFRRF